MKNDHEQIIKTIRLNILKKLDLPLKTSAQTLADKLNVSKTYAWDIMKGKNFNPKIATLVQIANTFDIELTELLQD